ncbi:MAG: Conserved hypothetical membrane protein [Parcubacteria group bacterium GW2011_GWA2_52_8]|nr:MAG: Conserved hypothetical membrane protein [Parcubacteria group bacterium GW2011_GWA2_52_8]
MTYFLILLLFILLMSMSRRISELEKRLRSTGSVQEPPKSSAFPAAVPPQPTLSAPAVAQSVAQPAPAISSAVTAPQKPRPVQSQEEVATNWFTRIGVLALLFGFGFFLKFAIEQGWIGQWTRVLLGFAAGGLLVALGELWRQKYDKYALALTGGGLAILYFSIFAAYQFYGLIPQFIGLALMMIVTALGTFLAIKDRSVTLAVLAAVGGYLTPIFLHSAVDQHYALFAYLSLLNIGVLLIVLRNYWETLFIAALVGTTFDFFMWAFNFVKPENAFGSTAFILFTYVLFLLFPIIYFYRSGGAAPLNEQKEVSLAATYILSAVFAFSATYMVLAVNFRDALPYVILLEGLLTLTTYFLIYQKNYLNLNAILASVSLFFLAIGAHWYFLNNTEDLVFVILSLAAIALGSLLKRVEFETLGLVLLLLSFLVSLSFSIERPEPFELVLEGFLVLLLYFVIYSKLRREASWAMAVVGLLYLSSGAYWQFDGKALALAYLCLSILTLFTGALLKRFELRAGAFFLLVASLLIAVAAPYDMSTYVFIFNSKFGLLLLEVIGLLASFLLMTLVVPNERERGLPDLLLGTAVLLLWFAFSWELFAYFRGSSSVNSRNLFLSLWWMAYAAVIMVVGVLGKKGMLRRLAFVLFSISIFKVFIYDVLSLEIGYRVVSFIVLGVLLLSVSFAYSRNKEKIKRFLSGEVDGDIAKRLGDLRDRV